MIKVLADKLITYQTNKLIEKGESDLHKHSSWADLEKVVNFPQVVNLEIYNVLKIAWFATKGDQKYVY